MSGARSAVGGPLYPFDSRFPAQAKKRPWPQRRLIATLPNSEIELTDWNERLLTISNRNTNRPCSFHIRSVSLLLPGESAPIRLSKLTNHDPRIPAILIANEILEFAVTRSKHMTEPGSNREKLRGAPKHSFTSFRSPRASWLAWVAEMLSRSPDSHFLHSYCDACNILPTKSSSGVSFVKRSEHAIASHLALLVATEVSDPNQTARGGRMKK
jgi:hypothetical protein